MEVNHVKPFRSLGDPFGRASYHLRLQAQQLHVPLKWLVAVWWSRCQRPLLAKPPSTIYSLFETIRRPGRLSGRIFNLQVVIWKLPLAPG